MRKFLIIFDSVFNGLFILLLVSFCLNTSRGNSSEIIKYLSTFDHKNNIIFYDDYDISYNNKYNKLKNKILCMDNKSIVYEFGSPSISASIIIETNGKRELISGVSTIHYDYFKRDNSVYYRSSDYNYFYKFNITNKKNYPITSDDYYEAMNGNSYLIEFSNKDEYGIDNDNNLCITHNDSNSQRIITLDAVKECQFIKDMNINKDFFCGYEVFYDEIYITTIINKNIGLVLKYDFFEDKLDYYDWLYMPPSTFNGFRFYIFNDDYPPIINYFNS